MLTTLLSHSMPHLLQITQSASSVPWQAVTTILVSACTLIFLMLLISSLSGTSPYRFPVSNLQMLLKVIGISSKGNYAVGVAKKALNFTSPTGMLLICVPTMFTMATLEHTL